MLAEGLLSALLLRITWRAWRALDRWVQVPRQDAPTAPDDAPAVSVLVPARNEARAIERCVRSLLAQHYPPERLRVVVVDDESTDGTQAILAGLASQDERLRVVAGTPPPAGWLGKCWALHQAVQHADPSARYLLFTDADTVHDPRALVSAVAYLRQHRLDLLSLGTGQELVGRGERLLLPFILGLAMLANGTFDEVNDPTRPERAKANGQFILVSAPAYAIIGGHAAVRRAVVEDFELARRAKRLGLRLLLADGRRLVRTRGYHSMREIWQGFSKNGLAEARRQPGGVLAVLVGLPTCALGPYLLLALAVRRLIRQPTPTSGLSVAQAAVQVGQLIALTGRCATAIGLPAGYGLAQPVATVFVWLLLVASAVRQTLGLPPTWKGRPILDV